MTFDLRLLLLLLLFIVFFYCEHFTFWWQCNVNFWWQREVENKTKQNNTTFEMKRKRSKLLMVIIEFDVWNSILASHEMCSNFIMHTIFRLCMNPSGRHTIWLSIKVMVAGNLTKDFIRRIDYKINIPPSPLLLMSERECECAQTHGSYTKQSAP